MDINTEASAEQRLISLSIELPNVPRPIPSFVPWKRHNDLVYLAAQNCVWNGAVVYAGKVGHAIDLETGQKAARLCALNLVAALREAVDGNLDRVTSCLRVGGFVNCTPDFTSVPHVVNGASDCFHQIFGPAIAAHARTAIGVNQLPQGAAVAVDAVFAVTI